MQSLQHSCMYSSISGSRCEEDLACACATQEYLENMACCLSSSCGATDLSVALSIFATEICPPTTGPSIINTSRCNLANPPPELRGQLERPTSLAKNGATTSTISKRDSASNTTSLSTGAKVGIVVAAVCAVAIIALVVFLYIRRKRNPPNRMASPKRGPKQPMKQQDEEELLQLQQLQLELQQQQEEIQQQKLEQKQQEERKYVAELQELPSWMPEREVKATELADTGLQRYEMMTEANTAELPGGTPVQDNADERLFVENRRRSRSYTAELSAGTPVQNTADEGSDSISLKRSRSDAGPIISPLDHLQPDAGRVLSPFDVSPPTATVPRQVFSSGDWRTTGSDTAVPKIYLKSDPDASSRLSPQTSPETSSSRPSSSRSRIGPEKEQRLGKRQRPGGREAAVQGDRSPQPRGGWV
jgi:hypothetical protein